MTDVLFPEAAFGASRPFVPRPREGPLTEPTAGAQPWLREGVFMPLSRQSLRRVGVPEEISDETR